MSVREWVCGEGVTGCLVVAEVAQAHDGSLGTAHAFIDAISSTGADAVKFQTHIGDRESTAADQWRIRFSPQDETRLDYWRRMEFSEQQWQGLRDHAEEVRLAFLSSPFSLEAVELLTRVGVPAWKVASGEITNWPMLEAMAATGLPLIVSTGMIGWAELDELVARLDSGGTPVALLQCTSSYPCPPERIGLNVLTELKERYGHAVGLSDHSATIFPSLAAVTLGAELVEIHVTLSREMFGPDVTSSVTISDLAELVRGVRLLGDAIDNPVDKDAVAAEMEPMRALFEKSIVAARALPAGTVLAPEHLAYKKPGGGIPPSRVERVIGAILTKDVVDDEPITDDVMESSS